VEEDTNPALPIPVTVHESSAVAVREVRARWDKFKNAAGRRRKTVPALLAWCDPLRVEGGWLILGNKNPSLQSKLNDPRVLEALQAATQDVFGELLQVRVESYEESSVPQPQPLADDLIDYGLALGAQITEIDETPRDETEE
jgi:hypothetical protein